VLPAARAADVDEAATGEAVGENVAVTMAEAIAEPLGGTKIERALR
jgi:hypothetical protein